jgi:hypothetical protein
MTVPRKTQPRMDPTPKWTQLQMDPTPNGPNPKWSQPQMDSNPNGLNPECIHMYIYIYLYFILCVNSIGRQHRWASTSAFMSAISDIRHRHLLFRYWNKICQTKSFHSDIGRVMISTSASIPISD